MGKKADAAYAEGYFQGHVDGQGSGYIDGYIAADADAAHYIEDLGALAYDWQNVALDYAHDLAILEDSYRTYLLDQDTIEDAKFGPDASSFFDRLTGFYGYDLPVYYDW